MNTQRISSGFKLNLNNSLAKDPNPIYISGHRTAWKERLICVLSQYCGCACYTEKDINKKAIKYYLVGRNNNIDTMRFLWEWLSTYIHQIATKEMKGAGRIIINSYCLGYITALQEMIVKSPSRLEASRNEQEAKHYIKLTHYEVFTIAPCSNFNVDNTAFLCGKLHGQMLNLQNITTC